MIVTVVCDVLGDREESIKWLDAYLQARSRSHREARRKRRQFVKTDPASLVPASYGSWRSPSGSSSTPVPTEG